MQITGSANGYTFGTVNLGLLGTGANAYKNLDEFASRAKPSVGDLPSGEMEENITLILRGYTDAGYSDLKWTFERVVTVHWINSVDAAFTVDELDNFDDGTVQDWAVAFISSNDMGTVTANIAVATDYVLSAPYSAKMNIYGTQGYSAATWERWIKGKLYKAFTTPNKDEVFAIIDLRISGTASTGSPVIYGKQVIIQKDADTLISLGKNPDTVGSEYFPKDKWVRVVVPLPKNTSITLNIITAVMIKFVLGAVTDVTLRLYSWLDDFKIISK